MKNKTKLKHSELKSKHIYAINEGSIAIMKKQFIKAFLNRIHINDLSKLVNLKMKDLNDLDIELSCSLWVDKVE